MKKITFFISSLSGGGAEAVCVNLANGLVCNGWQIDLVILNIHNEKYLKLLSSKVNLIVLNVDHARFSPIPLLKYIQKQKPEKILTFNYELTVLVVILRSLFRFPTKIIARNINTLSKKRQQYNGWWNKFIVKPLIDHFYCKADHIINQCQAMRDDLLTVFPQLKDQTSVIYNPVAKQVEEYNNEDCISPTIKQDYLLCIGRLEKQKAFHFAIQAFAELVKVHPKLRLKIIGQGSLENSLRQLTIKLKIENSVDFEGFQENVIPYYLGARATLLTSIHEGFPNVLIESISLGTAVVAFDCPSGPNEIIEEGKNGYLVEYMSIDSLIKSCNRILDNDINSKLIISTAQKYNSRSIIEQYSNILSSLN
ncbi:glycosyltransferase [Providencia sp. PROV036]|uniref:glycosyltransferase n=1 Tax=Providencia sp. PROV036 TaxID=2949767 RepID=UPI002349AA6B|nr:glycosyltransferase [Providencia sp. PROV036]